MPNTGDYVRAKDFDELKPQLSIGTVTTGAAGTNASASVTGTTPNFKLNLTIPRGNTGATGPAGPSGTFTGPLKPTAAYWTGAVIKPNANYGLWYAWTPSGGTWAYHRSLIADVTGVVAGNTMIQQLDSYNTNVGNYYLCWRIQ